MCVCVWVVCNLGHVLVNVQMVLRSELRGVRSECAMFSGSAAGRVFNVLRAGREPGRVSAFRGAARGT